MVLISAVVVNVVLVVSDVIASAGLGHCGQQLALDAGVMLLPKVATNVVVLVSVVVVSVVVLPENTLHGCNPLTEYSRISLLLVLPLSHDRLRIRRVPHFLRHLIRSPEITADGRLSLHKIH